MLDLEQLIDHLRRQWSGQQNPQHGIQFIDVAKRMHPWAVLGDPRAIAEPGGALITRSRINL